MTPSPPHPRWLLPLYVATSSLLLLPIWTVSRVPSIDGPCHLYNAWLLHHLHDPAQPLLDRTFELALRPEPNWLIQGLLYALLGFVAPALAEKLLLTLYAVLFAGTAWWFAGSEDGRRRPWAFLALPFTYHLMTFFGFYNFALSVPLALLAIGTWWRGRGRPTVGYALRVGALLLLCYLAHLVALGVALLAIGVLWLAAWPQEGPRRWLLHPLLLAPQLLLPLWFVATHASAPAANDWPLAQRLAYLGELQALWFFRPDTRIGTGLALLVALLGGLTLGRPAAGPASRQPRARWPGLADHAFLLAALAVAALYLAAPGGVGEGSLLQARLSLFPVLLLLPGLASRPGHGVQAAVALALALLVGWEAIALARWQRGLARGVDAFLAGLDPTPAGTRVLALVAGRYDSFEREVMGHALGHVAIAKGLVDWDDYQAASAVFPVHFRPGLGGPEGVEEDLDTYPVAAFAPTVDALYLWALPPTSPLRPRLAPLYRLARRRGEGELWLRR